MTHFVAPAFIILAGTSAFFYGRKHTDLSRFLLVRGVWLVLLELTVIRVARTLNFDFANYLLAGVIWVIGWCMILMAALVKLRPRTIGIIGVAIIVLHDAVMGPLINALPLGELWKILYIGFFNGPVAGTPLIVLYSIIPWIGVMAAGYAFGSVLAMEPARRNRICLRLGLGATALFLVLRGFSLYGDPRPWSATPPMPAWLSFLNTTKYPASLSFLLMTLGPTKVPLESAATAAAAATSGASTSSKPRSSRAARLRRHRFPRHGRKIGHAAREMADVEGADTRSDVPLRGLRVDTFERARELFFDSEGHCERQILIE